MFQLLSTITLKFGICLYNVKLYAQQYIKNINKNIFNNFLITTPRCTHTLLFQKLLSPAPALAPPNPKMHSCFIANYTKPFNKIFLCFETKHKTQTQISNLDFQPICTTKHKTQTSNQLKKTLIRNYKQPHNLKSNNPHHL